MDKQMERRFDAADKAVLGAAVKIQRAIEDLFRKTDTLDDVAYQYVVERLIMTLIQCNPEALDYLNRQRGKASVRLANALMDWRDQWGER
jgi:hypothetical protein